MKLIHSFPPLDEASFQNLEAVLLDWFEYPSLPADYREFLLKHNGGIVDPGYGVEEVPSILDEGPSQLVVFDTPLRWARKEGQPPCTPALVAFFGARLPKYLNPSAIPDTARKPPELIASNEHSKIDFDVLPDKMMSIGICSDRYQPDLLCLSLDPRDFGNVYYYDCLVYHPMRSHGDYYDDKRRQIMTKYALESEDEIDSDSEAGGDALFELGRVHFVKVADSFTAFLANCRIVERET